MWLDIERTGISRPTSASTLKATIGNALCNRCLNGHKRGQSSTPNHFRCPRTQRAWQACLRCWQHSVNHQLYHIRTTQGTALFVKVVVNFINETLTNNPALARSVNV
jgi:hypothetical protein